MRHVSYDEIKRKGIPGSLHTIKRKERMSLFPKSSGFGDRLKNTWAEPVIDAYAKAIAAGCTEKEATIIAERERPRLPAATATTAARS